MNDFFDRYGDRIEVNVETGCWEWIGAKAAGYGHFNREGEHHYAHRAAFEWREGEGSADGLIVRHECDNPPCCNPFHVCVGTHADNVADMIERGRANPPRGEANFWAKVTEADVLAMRKLAAEGWPIARIAELYPLKHDTVMFAVTGRTWSHLPGSVSDLVKAKPPGSWRPGETPTVILNAESVADIKARLRRGATGRSLAREYGVSPATISAIKKGRNWAHVAAA